MPPPGCPLAAVPFDCAVQAWPSLRAFSAPAARRGVPCQRDGCGSFIDESFHDTSEEEAALPPPPAPMPAAPVPAPKPARPPKPKAVARAHEGGRQPLQQPRAEDMPRGDSAHVPRAPIHNPSKCPEYLVLCPDLQARGLAFSGEQGVARVCMCVCVWGGGNASGEALRLTPPILQLRR